MERKKEEMYLSWIQMKKLDTTRMIQIRNIEMMNISNSLGKGYQNEEGYGESGGSGENNSNVEYTSKGGLSNGAYSAGGSAELELCKGVTKNILSFAENSVFISWRPHKIFNCVFKSFDIIDLNIFFFFML